MNVCLSCPRVPSQCSAVLGLCGGGGADLRDPRQAGQLGTIFAPYYHTPYSMGCPKQKHPRLASSASLINEHGWIFFFISSHELFCDFEKK